MQQDCEPSLRPSACTLGNASGIISTVLWFIVLVPQLVRNQQRRSVRGLNPLWALANFTASLCNMIFMFRIQVPVQTRVMAIYMPVIEMLMLLQFFFWYEIRDGDLREDESENEPEPTSEPARKWWIVGACIVIWSSIVIVQLFVYSSSSYFAWAAIALWSVETFPQLYTNIKNPRAAVEGQSSVSILITCCGKTTDSLSAFLLKMPTQTRVLAYYSGTSAWLNALYVLVIYVNRKNSNQHQDDDDVDERGKESESTKLIDTNASESVSMATKVENWVNELEIWIRYSFATSLGLRIFFSLLLSSLIAAVITGCVLTIDPTWTVAFLPLSTAAVLLVFYVILIRGGDNGGVGCEEKKR